MGKTFSECEQHYPAGWSSRWNKEWKKRKIKPVSAGIVSVLPSHDAVGHDDVNCLALPCLLIMMDRDL